MSQPQVQKTQAGKVMFYHLAQHRPVDLIRRLSERALASGHRVMLRAPDPRKLDQIDDLLWTTDPTGFLPHGRAGADQPLLLGEGAVENGAKVLMLLAGAVVDAEEARSMERLCYLFEDGDEVQKQAARIEWRAVVAAGLTAEYWSDAEGTWVKKAQSGAEA